MKIGIVGIGYVGLPLVHAFCENNISCIGFDIDQKKVDDLNNAKSFLNTPSNEELSSFIKKKLFHASSNFKEIKDVTHIVICVPTPIDKYRKPDLTFVKESIKSVLPHLQKGCLISLESTTYPGTTRTILKNIIEKNGMKVGEDVFLSYSPEREDPGNNEFNLKNTPKLVSGLSKKCLAKAKKLYSLICESVVEVSSLEVAETAKLVENIQRSVNIGLMNELKILADSMGVNIFEVIDAAATKPFGFSKYYPGPGVGGHCIPVDPFYLTYKAKEYGIDTKFIELAGEVNRSMPNFVINKISDALNQKKLSINSSKILCLGISYKKNVGDTRESPPVEIFDKLKKLGANVDYADPFFKIFPKTKKYVYKDKAKSIIDIKLSDYDLVVLLTDHDEWDYKDILNNSKIIIDTRGKYHALGFSSKKIVIA